MFSRLSSSRFLPIMSSQTVAITLDLYSNSFSISFHYRRAWTARGGACQVAEVRSLHKLLFSFSYFQSWHSCFVFVFGSKLFQVKSSSAATGRNPCATIRRWHQCLPKTVWPWRWSVAQKGCENYYKCLGVVPKGLENQVFYSGLIDPFCYLWFQFPELTVMMFHQQETIWKKQRDPVWH